ncbi:hypothetical protein ABIB40_000920 [Pedobacter sp. UYP30]
MQDFCSALSGDDLYSLRFILVLNLSHHMIHEVPEIGRNFYSDAQKFNYLCAITDFHFGFVVQRPPGRMPFGRG